jgi:hypothetical protein
VVRPVVIPILVLNDPDQQGVNTVSDLSNPFLDDDDEVTDNSTNARPIFRPVIQPSDEVLSDSKPWDKPVRTPDEEAELEDRKRAGDVPTGKKKRRSTMTEKDAKLLAFLSVYRVSTAEQMSMLLTTSETLGNKGGEMASPKTVLNRLLRLKEIGAVQDASLWNEQRVWGVTDLGRGAAIAFGLVGRDGQIQQKGLRGLNYTTVPHTLAVNQVAAQLLSPFGILRGKIALPPKMGFESLLTEYQVNNAWLKANATISANNKEKNLNRKFKDWRTATVKELHEALQAGKLDHRDVAETEPALWALGQTPAAGDDVREHHLPDLVVNLERYRKNASRGSIAIEVELVSKSVSSYRRQLTLWAAELDKKTGYPDPLLYSKLIYFTNDEAVKENLARADKLQETKLIESGKLIILPLTQRDGTTPLNLSTRL